MSDKSTFQSGRYTQESGDNGSVSRAPSTSAGSGTRTLGGSTEMVEDGDETVYARSDVEEDVEMGKMSHQQRAVLLRESLAHFDKQDPKEQEAIYAALAAARTAEERDKIYNGPMFRPPPPTPAQSAEPAQQTERDRLVELFMSGRTEEAVAMCKKDENGFYINPWKKKSGPPQ